MKRKMSPHYRNTLLSHWLLKAKFSSEKREKSHHQKMTLDSPVHELFMLYFIVPFILQEISNDSASLWFSVLIRCLTLYSGLMMGQKKKNFFMWANCKDSWRIPLSCMSSCNKMFKCNVNTLMKMEKSV